MQLIIQVVSLIAALLAGLVQWFKFFFNEEPLWGTPDFLKDFVSEELCYMSIIIWGIVFCIPGIIVWIVRNK